MDLVRAEQALGRNAHLLGHPAAIFRDTGWIVVRAEPAIEGFVDSTGHPALAGEERVAQPRNGCEQRRSERHAVSSPGAGGSSLRPATFIISESGRHSNTAPTGAARTSGGNNTSKRGIGSSEAANISLPLASRLTTRSCQPVSRLTT